MPYYEIRDWSKGVDLRRLAESTRAGAMLVGENCHVTRGGEVEKRKAIVQIYSLPSSPTNHGLWVDADGNHHVWSISPDPGGLDSRVIWHQVVNPDNALEEINRILSYDDFYSTPYVVVEFEDGSVHHYYGDERIREDGGLPPDADAAVPPAFGNGRAYTPYFTLSIDSVATPASSVTEVWLIPPAEVGTPANWIQLNSASVPYASGTQEWARDLAAEVNTFVSTPDVYCEASDGRVRFSMATVDPQYNGYMIQLTITGDGQALPTRTQTMTFGEDNSDPAIPDAVLPGDYDYSVEAIYYLKGGTTPQLAFRNPSIAGRPSQLDTVTVDGTDYMIPVDILGLGGPTPSVEKPGWVDYPTTPAPSGHVVDQEYAAYGKFFSINLEGIPDLPGTPDPEPDTDPPPPPTASFTWQPGRFILVHGSKVYATSGPALNFSAIGNARVWNPDFAGAGFIDSSIQSSGPKKLQSIGQYGEAQLGLFAQKDIQIWSVDPDPEQNRLIKVLPKTGTYAPRSVTSWGSDLTYLDKVGIRSLRARDSSNAAWVNDIGVPIDDLVKYIATSAGPLAERAIGAVDPDDGRFMLAINRTIFVFSFFPQSKIAAWTVYRPGFRIEEMAEGPDKIFFRSGTSVYALGGETGQEYDSCDVTVETPFLDFDDPGTWRTLQGFDCACSGNWSVQIATDPLNPLAFDPVANIENSTYKLYRVALVGYTSHLSLKFTHSAAGPAKLGTVLIHYMKGESG